MVHYYSWEEILTMKAPIKSDIIGQISGWYKLKSPERCWFTQNWGYILLFSAWKIRQTPMYVKAQPCLEMPSGKGTVVHMAIVPWVIATTRWLPKGKRWPSLCKDLLLSFETAALSCVSRGKWLWKKTFMGTSVCQSFQVNKVLPIFHL